MLHVCGDSWPHSAWICEEMTQSNAINALHQETYVVHVPQSCTELHCTCLPNLPSCTSLKYSYMAETSLRLDGNANRSVHTRSRSRQVRRLSLVARWSRWSLTGDGGAARAWFPNTHSCMNYVRGWIAAHIVRGTCLSCERATIVFARVTKRVR